MRQDDWNDDDDVIAGTRPGGAAIGGYVRKAERSERALGLLLWAALALVLVLTSV